MYVLEDGEGNMIDGAPTFNSEEELRRWQQVVAGASVAARDEGGAPAERVSPERAQQLGEEATELVRNNPEVARATVLMRASRQSHAIAAAYLEHFLSSMENGAIYGQIIAQSIRYQVSQGFDTEDPLTVLEGEGVGWLRQMAEWVAGREGEDSQQQEGEDGDG